MADRVEGDPTPIPRGDDKNVGEPTPWTTWGFAGERQPSWSTDPRVQTKPIYEGMNQADTAKWYWEQMAESGQVIREQVRSYYPPDPRSTSMFDPMLLQAYTNNPQGFMETIYPLLTQNQQAQFAQVQRREVEVKNAEGAFGDPMSTPIAGRPAPKKDEKTEGQQGAGGGPQNLGPQSQKTVQDAVKQRDALPGQIDRARGGDPKGTFAPFEIKPPLMPAQTTTGQTITPTAAQTPTVTVTPGVPQTSNAQNPLTRNATDPNAGSQQERTIAGSGVELAPHRGPAIAISEPTAPAAGQPAPTNKTQQGWAPTNAVLANVPINKSGQTQAIGLSDWAIKNGFNLAPYAQGGMIEEPVVGQGQNSGAIYTFGEKGRERVMPEGPYRTEIKLRSGHRISVGGSD